MQSNLVPDDNELEDPVAIMLGNIAVSMVEETLPTGHDVEIPYLGIVFKGDRVRDEKDSESSSRQLERQAE